MKKLIFMIGVAGLGAAAFLAAGVSPRPQPRAFVPAPVVAVEPAQPVVAALSPIPAPPVVVPVPALAVAALPLPALVPAPAPAPSRKRIQKRKRVAAVLASPRHVASADSQPDSPEEPGISVGVELGFGARYVSLKQSGAFGAGNGSAISGNNVSVRAKAKHGDWSVGAEYDRFSLDFNDGLLTSPTRVSKSFQNFVIEPGFRMFSLGLKASVAPMMQVSTTSIQWMSTTSISAFAGIHWEREFAGQSKKPAAVRVDLRASYLVSASGDTGTSLASPSGYGIDLAVNAERSISSSASHEVHLGLGLTASGSELHANGTWGNASGAIQRTIVDAGAHAYVGVAF